MVAALFVAACTYAQQIKVVDDEGMGIPLVSVMTEDGILIGTTDLEGVLDNVRGAKKVELTHVAYKPQLASVSAGTTITMEELDYSLEEVVVKPKPYIYVETYYRAYGFINDSLRYYTAGILPNAYDIQKKKVETGSNLNSCGEFYPSFGVSLTWGSRARVNGVGKAHTPTYKEMLPDGKLAKKYYLTLTDEGNGRQRISNEEGTLGYIVKDDGQISTTLDAGKTQMYANKVDGQERLLKRREEKNYEYQYTDIFKIDEDGNSSITDFVMYTNHWQWDGGKGRDKLIIETYATGRGYMDKDEWKAKKKELKKEYEYMMSLDELEQYATSHNIPALSPTMRAAIEGLKKKKDKDK